MFNIKHLRLWSAVAAMAPAGVAAQDEIQNYVVNVPDVVVTATRVALPAEQIGSAVTVVTGEDLEQRQVRVVSDVLRDVPGLAVNRSGPTGAFTQIRMRGAEGNQTLVMIDGIKVNNPALASDFDFGNLLNFGIDRIEVMRGPQSAIYGGDAIGGVINIATPRPDDGLVVNALGEAGSFVTRNGIFNMQAGAERAYITATVSRFDSDGISAADENNGNTEADGYDNTTGHAKAGIQPFEWLEIDAIGMVIRSTREADANVVRINAIDSGDTSETNQLFGSARATVTLFDGMWEQIVRATRTEDDTDFFDSLGALTFVSDGAKTKFDYQSNFQLPVPAAVLTEHGLTLVAERQRESQFTDSAFVGPNTVDVLNHGYAAEYRAALYDRLYLLGGVRYDDNDEIFENELTYRGTLAYLLDQTGTRLHGSWGRAVKNPTLFELFGFTPTFTGNPNLVAERSIGWDAGVEQYLLNERLVIDVTYFQNRIKDLIQGAGNQAFNLGGTTRVNGIEVTAAAQLLPGLSANAAYTYTNAEAEDGSELIRRPRHIASANLNYAFEAWQHPANVNLSVRHNGRQLDTVFDSFFPVILRRVTLDAYTLVNLSASVQVYDGIEIFGRIENMFDEQYQDVFGFGTPGVSGFAGVRIGFDAVEALN